MDWAHPHYLWLALPAVAVLLLLHRGSTHPMSLGRRRALLAARTLMVLLALLALAAPALRRRTARQAVIFVVDHSQSLGPEGAAAACRRAGELASRLPRSTPVGFVSAGASSVVRIAPAKGRPEAPAVDEQLLTRDGGQTNLAAAVDLAQGLFPPDHGKRIVLVTDAFETTGDLESAAHNAALAGVVIDAAPVAGQTRGDVRLLRLRASQSRAYEGASLELTADVESTLTGQGRIRLFENGIEIASQPLKLTGGAELSIPFRVTPEQRNLYTYRAVVEGFDGDAIPHNDAAVTMIDVRGRPVLLYVEGKTTEANYLAAAMAREGIRLDVRPASAIPQTLGEMAGYDGVILSDVPAHQLPPATMTLLRDYVGQLGGGFLMIGGVNSFGVGGYYRTPVEEILPVKMKAPDKEVKMTTALALVLDRSGSMRGEKVEICKSAAVSAVELLTAKDYIAVVAFDSSAHWIVPVMPVSDRSAISSRISTIHAQGGTNLHPAMTAARTALASCPAKIKHMLILSDGQTSGSGYPELARQCFTEGITISTVAIGSGAHAALLQSVATAGGGKFYQTVNIANIPQIFTQDTMVHAGRLIREESFTPEQVERHPMLKGWSAKDAPQLLGYVKTLPKATSQVPLVTDMGDPLLAHWRFGLGKVTAFTSDCKSRWSALWLTNWPAGYSQFWAQVLREMARRPQGRNMDIRLTQAGRKARVSVDLLADAGRFQNEAQVTADVYFQSADAVGAALTPVRQVRLVQEGPGFYAGEFIPEKAGTYLVRARSGAQMVSAALVHQVNTEAATGKVNRKLLRKVCDATGGAILADDAKDLPPARAVYFRYLELQPWLLILLLLTAPIDLAIRRWEQVRGMVEVLTGRGR